MTNILIRLANQYDAPVITEFNIAMALEIENKDLPYEIISSGVETLLKNPQNGFYIVAEIEGNVVASLMVTKEWSDWRNGFFWWVQSVYVRREFRRQGIYAKMYQFVKNEANNKTNVCGFRLYVKKDNIHAQKTYEALGMLEAHYKMYEEI